MEAELEVVKGLSLAVAGPGTRALAVIDGRIVSLVAPVGANGPLQRQVLPAPGGGRVLSLGIGNEGPVAVTANGACWCWSEHEKKWVKFGNLRDEASR